MTASLLALFRQLERFPLSIIQLAMRIGVGSVFFKAGLLKYSAWTEHLVWASILALPLTRGPGAFSFDYLIARRCGPAQTSTAPVSGSAAATGPAGGLRPQELGGPCQAAGGSRPVPAGSLRPSPDFCGRATVSWPCD